MRVITSCEKDYVFTIIVVTSHLNSLVPVGCVTLVQAKVEVIVNYPMPTSKTQRNILLVVQHFDAYLNATVMFIQTIIP